MQGGPGKDNEGKDDETARIQPGLGSRPRLPALTLGAPARASWRRRRCARAGPAAPRPPARSLALRRGGCASRCRACALPANGPAPPRPPRTRRKRRCYGAPLRARREKPPGKI